MRRVTLCLLPALLVLLAGCATAGKPRGELAGGVEIGMASFYGRGDGYHQQRTASGERYDRDAMTAAHRTLPFGTRVRVTRIETGKSVVVTINDRGPHRRGRVIDVSYRAARELGFVGAGVTRVRVEVVGS